MRVMLLIVVLCLGAGTGAGFFVTMTPKQADASRVATLTIPAVDARTLAETPVDDYTVVFMR